MKPKRSNLFLVAAAIVVTSSAHAASDSWKVNSAGNWNAAGSWTMAIPGSTTTDNTDVATFSFTLTTGRIVTVDTRYIGGISFGNTSNYGYTLSGGALKLNNSGVIQNLAGNGNHTDTISTPITLDGTTAIFRANATSTSSILSIGAVNGSATSATTLTLNGTNTANNAITGIIANGVGGNLSITKSDAGSWRLSGANTYTGGTSLSAGTLSFNAGGLGTTGTIDLTGSSTLLWNGTNTDDLSARLSMADGITATFNTGTNNVTFANGIGNNTTSAVSKTGTGTLTLSGTTTYTGATLVSGGYLAFGSGTAPATSLISVTANASLVASGAFTTVQGWLGSGKVDSTSTGSIAIQADHTGSINFAGFDSLGLSATGAFTCSGPITPGSNGFLFGGEIASNLTVSSVLTGSANLTQFGLGTTTLTGNNTYTGKTFINSGTLSISSGNNLGTNTTVDIGAGTNQGTLKYTGTGETIGRVINLASTTGNAALDASGSGLVKFTSNLTATGSGAKTLRLQGTTTGEIAGVIVDSVAGATGLQKLGTGTWTLSGENTCSGFTSFNGGSPGTLRLANTNALQNSTYLGGSGTLQFDSSVVSNAFTFGGIGSSAAIALQNNAPTPAPITLSVGNNNSDNSSFPYTGVLSGAGSLIKIGTGTLTLQGSNTYTGTTTINSGTLRLNNTNALQNSTLNYSAGTLAFSTLSAKAFTLGGLAGSKDIALVNSKTPTAEAITLSIGNNHADTTYSGTFSGGGALTKIGTGKLTLTGINTYTGNTSVNGGTLSLANATLADASTVSIAAGATLNLTYSSTDTVKALFINGIQRAPGLYRSASAAGPGRVLASLTGNGKLLVTTGPTNNLDFWIGTFDFSSFPSEEITATGDVDHDGISNLVEHIFGTAPNAATTGLTQIGATATTLTFQHPLNATLASDVSYSYQWSSDLSEWKASGVANTGGTIATMVAGAPVANEVTVTATLSGTPAAKVFVRIIANQAP